MLTNTIKLSMIGFVFGVIYTVGWDLFHNINPIRMPDLIVFPLISICVLGIFGSIMDMRERRRLNVN